MKVKVINEYHDKQLDRIVKVGEELDVTNERAKELIYHDVAEPTTPEVVTEPVAKKTTTRKKKVEG